MEWDTDLAAMPLARHGHACGPWKNVDASGSPTEMVVVGGVGAESSTLVYSLENDSWRQGTGYYSTYFRFGQFLM